MAEGSRPTWKKFLPLVALPAIAGPVFVLVFILRTESAHDESQCPYQEVTQRTLADGATIVEQRRSCLPQVEERRFLLRRETHQQVLGRRRFDPSAFAGPEYAWDAGVRESGEVHMFVQNPGHGGVSFREGRADEK